MERWCCHQVRATWSWERSQICRKIQVQKGGCFTRAPLGVYGISVYSALKWGHWLKALYHVWKSCSLEQPKSYLGSLRHPKKERGGTENSNPWAHMFSSRKLPHLCARARWLALLHHVPLSFLFHGQFLQSRASSFCRRASLIRFTWIRLLRFNCLAN